MMRQNYDLEVNGKVKSLEAEIDEPLLYVLRDFFELNGPKFGCGLHQCGSCMVLVDGKPTYTCRIPSSDFEGKKIKSIEGLEEGGRLHVLQQAFYELQAAQCGYCLNGMLISAVSLLESNPKPSVEEIKEALNPIICRCGTHSRFIKAIQKVTQP
jgi:nicotinate dehydrogenase subunit A